MLNNFVRIPKVVNFVVKGKERTEKYKLFFKDSCLCKYKACSKKYCTFAIKILLFIYSILSTVPFKVVPCTGDSPFPTFLPLLECFLERTFCDGAQFSCRILLNLLYGLETTSFQSGFNFGKQENVCWGYVRRIGLMGHNGWLMFCQITPDEARRVSRRIVVVQHPSLVFPQFKSWSPPNLLYNEYRVFPGGKERPEHDTDSSPLSSAAVMKE